MTTPVCPYCKNEAKFVDGTKIYPHRPDLANKKFWSCDPCGAYVGCHEPSIHNDYEDNIPLGRLADSELRYAKSRAHVAFDMTWKTGMFRSRSLAYAWLARVLKISQENCHIGMFDIETCNRARQAAIALMNKGKEK